LICCFVLPAVLGQVVPAFSNLFAPSMPSMYWDSNSPQYNPLTGTRSDCFLIGHGVEPHKSPYAFKYCRQYEMDGCCSTGHDFDIGTNWQQITNVGQECPYNRWQNKPELQQFSCSGCSPNQPKYVRFYPPYHPEANRTFNGQPMAPIRYFVCQDFVNRLLGPDMSRYDDCGLRLLNTNDFNNNGNVITISKYFSNDVIGQTSFLNSFIPSGFDNAPVGFAIYIWTNQTAPNDPNTGVSLYDAIQGPTDARYCFNSASSLSSVLAVALSLLATVLLVAF